MRVESLTGSSHTRLPCSHVQDVEKLAAKKGVVLQTIKEVLQVCSSDGLCWLSSCPAARGGLLTRCVHIECTAHPTGTEPGG